VTVRLSPSAGDWRAGGGGTEARVETAGCKVLVDGQEQGEPAAGGRGGRGGKDGGKGREKKKDKEEEDLLRSSPPPVLSGHAASLTPY
jgi:hypothetical protein